MNMTENSRFILGLRAAGWSEKKINDFILYIESGDVQYMPKLDSVSDEMPDTEKKEHTIL